MNDKLLMNILRGLHKLSHEVGCFRFCQTLTALDHLVHALVVTQFEQNVTVGFVLEEMFVLAHILVLEGSVDFDFRFQLQMTRARIECDVRNLMDWFFK